jgi:hypothetical protein
MQPWQSHFVLLVQFKNTGTPFGLTMHVSIRLSGRMAAHNFGAHCNAYIDAFICTLFNDTFSVTQSYIALNERMTGK